MDELRTITMRTGSSREPLTVTVHRATKEFLLHKYRDGIKYDRIAAARRPTRTDWDAHEHRRDSRATIHFAVLALGLDHDLRRTERQPIGAAA